MKILLIFCLTISSAFAIDVNPIKKGEPAPRDGFFVDPENMKDLRQINEDKKRLEQQNLKLKDLSAVQNERIGLYKEEVKEQNKAIRKERTKGDIKGIGGFLLGVLATSVAAYAAIKVSK